MPLIPLPAWLPDIAAYDSAGITEALNVIPRPGNRYAPLRTLSAQTTEALTARCLGAFGCRDLAGAAHVFAGDATDLQKMESGGLTWDEVSRTSGGNYAATERWSFTQYGDRVLAADGVDAMQSYVLGSSTDFAALGGSSPIARYVTTIRDFVVAAAVAAAFRRVQWCAIDDPTDWATSATTLADQQDLPDGGTITGIVGGEFGTIFQQRAVKRMTFVGPPTIFQIDELLRDIGCMAPGSIAVHAHDCYFLADDGFHVLRGMAQLEHIGDSVVNDYFFKDFDANYPDRVTASVDPETQLYMVAYPGQGNSAGTPNRGLIYNPRINRWSRFEQVLESMFPAVQAASSYTLDTLDNVNASIDALAASLDSPLWTGEGRPFLAAFDNNHQLGTFSGTPMAARVDTGEVQFIPTRRATVRNLRPIGSPATISVSV